MATPEIPGNQTSRKKLCLCGVFLYTIVFLVIYLTWLHHYHSAESDSPRRDAVNQSNYSAETDSPQRDVFNESKSILLKEDSSSEFSRECSQLYGIQDLEIFQRSQIDVCSGFKDSAVSCFLNPTLDVHRWLCTVNNGRIEKISTGKGKKVIVDCNPEVYKNWVPRTGLWNENEKTLLTLISSTGELGCENFVEHPVFFLSRYATRNIFHALEDGVTAFESLLVLDLDPAEVELIIWDECSVDSPFFEMWKSIFGKGVRIWKRNPYGNGTCFRRSILNMDVLNLGMSVITKSRGLWTNTKCKSSPILKAFRHFLLQKLSIRIRKKEANNVGEMNQTRQIGFISRQQYKPAPDCLERSEHPHEIKRVLANEPQLISHIRERLPPYWSLIVLRPELMTSFKEQVEAFEGLHVLIGVHGAGFANVLFMNAGTHLIEIFHGDRDTSHRCYYNMCAWLGINYLSPGYFHEEVDPTKVWSVLESVLN